MGKKINLTEAELRKMIYEAIENAVNPGQTNPPEASTTQVPAANLKPVGKSYPGAIKSALEYIECAKNSLARFGRLPGEFFGIPDEQMKLFGIITNHLTEAEKLLSSIG